MITGITMLFSAAAAVFLGYDFYFMRKKESKIFLIFFLVCGVGHGLCFAGYAAYYQKSGETYCFIIMLIAHLCIIGVQKAVCMKLYQIEKNLLEKNSELELFIMKNRLEYQYYKIAGESVEEIHMLRHEISNQLQTAYYLFSENDEMEKQKAFDIINDLQNKLCNITMIDYCDNSVINAIMTVKFAEAGKKGIHTSYEIGSIRHLVIGESDLCSIFTNLFDNALEACSHNCNAENFITVRIYEKAGYLVIQFRNSFNGIVHRKNGELVTTKKDKQHHGYGMKLLKKIVKKYEGDMNIEVCGKEFIITLYLRINLIIY